MTVINMDNPAKELAEFCSVLWREREVLERVLFRIIEQQLILRAGQTRWLGVANSEVEAAVTDLRVTEVLRSAEADALAASLGLDSGATLAQLGAAATEPWSSILLEHRTALRELAAEVETATQDNRGLLGAGARAVRETLLSLSDAVATYNADGATDAVGRHHYRVDQQA